MQGISIAEVQIAFIDLLQIFVPQQKTRVWE